MAARLSSFTIGPRTIVVDLPHLAFATAIAAWCVWFCQDAWRAQRDVENLIMILPASLLAVILYIFVAAGCVRIVSAPAQHADPPRKPLDPGMATKIAGTMALLAAYVIAAPLIGFDLVSFAYILAMLLFLGERRIIVLLLVPALFCAIAIYCFDTILATPLPLLFFAGDAS
jgi:Tripartite tricarboxylate transporter TctB family